VTFSSSAPKKKSPISGGHNLARFYETIDKFPLRQVKDLNITDQTAPSRDIENHICKNVLEPVSNLLEKLMDNRYPMLSKCLKWKYRKKIEKMRHKYFDNQRTGEVFKKFKTYRLLLYKMNPTSI